MLVLVLVSTWLCVYLCLGKRVSERASSKRCCLFVRLAKEEGSGACLKLAYKLAIEKNRLEKSMSDKERKRTDESGRDRPCVCVCR